MLTHLDLIILAAIAAMSGKYGTKEYYERRKVYDNRFPQYKELFELENNELYVIKPLVIWNYNPAGGEMHRDVIVLDREYYDSIEVYVPHKYSERDN